MPTFHRTRFTATLCAAACALSATGCSSARDQAALSSLRKFTLSSRPAVFAIVTARNATAVQRHARDHAFAAIHTVPTPHHGTRNL